MIALRSYQPPRVETKTAMAYLLASLFVHLACIRPLQAPPTARSRRRRDSVLPLPAASIGVSRAAMQSVVGQRPARFAFRELTPVQGQPRVRGRSPDGAAIIELIGPASNLQQASFMVKQANSGQVGQLENMALLVEFLDRATPSDHDGDDWLYGVIITAFQQGFAVGIRGNVEIALRATRVGGACAMTFVVRGT